MPDVTLQPLLGGGINFSGMASYPPPDALPPGKMALAQNVRSAWGKPVVRLPLTTIGTPASNAGWCSGGAEFLQDGVTSIFTAIGYGPGIVNANGTNFWVSRNNGAAWTQMGVGAGAGASRYGQTTFNSQDTRVEFQVVTDRTWNGQTAYDLIVIQDGVAQPLIYGKSNSNTFGGGYGMSRGQASIPAPVAGPNLQYQTGFKNAWPIGITNGAQISMISGAGALSLLLGAAYVAGSNDTVAIVFSTPLNLTNATNAAQGQFIVLCSAQAQIVVSGCAAYGSTTTTQVAEEIFAGQTVSTSQTAQQLIEVTTATIHGLLSGQTVYISGVGGVPGANGTWTVTVIDSTHFLLNGSVFSGAYTSSTGTVYYGIADFMPQMKVTMYDGLAHSVVLYDPNTMYGTPVVIARDDIPGSTGQGLVQIAYPLPALSSTQTFDFTNVHGLDFTWEGQTPAVAQWVYFWEMAASGQFQGTTSFAAAYFSQDTRQIGAATYYPSVNLGATTNGPGITILDDQRFWYDYTVSIPNVPSASLDAGVDSGLLYAQLPGQTQPYLCGQILLGAWSAGAWGYQSGNATQSVSGWTIFPQDLSWPALSSAYLTLPVGLAMAETSERFIVGSGNTLWYSGAERPFQFAVLQQSDVNGNLLPQSPVSLTLSGQQVQAVLAIGSLAGGNAGPGDSALGVGTVFCFTDRAVLQMSGWDASSLSKASRLYDQGTYAPWSVATFQTGFIFWGADGHVVRYGINPQMPYVGMYCYAISRLIVEDILRAVPDLRIGLASAGVKDECYYLALSRAGTTLRGVNQVALVWDYNESFRAQDNVWFLDLFPSSVNGVARFFSFLSGYRQHLYGFDAAGQMIEHVTYGSIADAGESGVAWSLVFPELRADGLAPVLVRRAAVQCDANMGSLATSRVTQGRLAQVTSTAVLNTSTASGVAGTRCVRYDNVTAGGSVIPGVAATGVTFSLGGTSPSGAVIHNVSVEMGRQAADGPDVS